MVSAADTAIAVALLTVNYHNAIIIHMNLNISVFNFAYSVSRIF